MTLDQYDAFSIDQLTEQLTEQLTDYGSVQEIWLDIPWDIGPNTAKYRSPLGLH